MVSQVRKILWRDIRPPGGLYHVARPIYRPGRNLAVHTHNFAEVFWLERGRGEHRINGQSVALAAGDLVAIRPHDVHTFRAARGGFVMVNVAFEPEAFDVFASRYLEDGLDDDLPLQVRPPRRNLERLSEWADATSMRTQSELERDAFFVEVCLAVRGLPRDRQPVEGPPWLQQAVAQMQEPANLVGGVRRLAALCNRSVEHVSRTVRKHLHVTPTALINTMRLDYAGRRLRLTGEPIIQIAADCGLPNLPHFYKLFKAHHGVTPRQYRMRHQSPVDA